MRALALADRLDPRACGLKVGKEMFVVAGPEPVRWMVERGFAVFLDLKFHDIPNTVAQACAAATRLGVAMLNVHAGGGRAMLEAARDAVTRTAQAVGARAAAADRRHRADEPRRRRPARDGRSRTAPRVTRCASRASPAIAASTASSARRSRRRRCAPRSGLRSRSSRRASGSRARSATTRRASSRRRPRSRTAPTTSSIGRPITQRGRSGRDARRHQSFHRSRLNEDHDDRDRLRRSRHRRLPRRGRQRRPRPRRRRAQDRRSCSAGGVPIHEPGLQPMIERNVAAGRLRFTTDVDEAVAHGALQFIAVGTPPDEDGSADMSYVLQAARNIGAADRRTGRSSSTSRRCRWAPPTACAPRSPRSSRSAACEHRVRGRLESRIPEGRRGDRGFHAARSHRDRRRRSARGRGDARRLRAVPAQPRAACS